MHTHAFGPKYLIPQAMPVAGEGIQLKLTLENLIHSLVSVFSLLC